MRLFSTRNIYFRIPRFFIRKHPPRLRCTLRA